MYLFSRQARLGPGRIDAALTWALTVTEKVNQISEAKFSLWSTVFSPGVGTLAWTTTVDTLGVLEATDAKLLADAGYISLVNEGAAFNSGAPVDDAIVRLVSADVDPDAEPAYATVVQAVLAPGAGVNGIELGVEIAQRAKAVTGCRCSFGVAGSGPYGAVAWITGYSSIEQLEQAAQVIADDADFNKTIDQKASTAYQVGSATQTIWRRLS